MIKIGIGTAQFGLRYGVNNTEGIPNLDEIRNILNTARDNNVQIIDTAISYGDAHIKLGLIGVKDFKIATKIPRIEEKTESKIRHNKTQAEKQQHNNMNNGNTKNNKTNKTRKHNKHKNTHKPNEQHKNKTTLTKH